MSGFPSKMNPNDFVFRKRTGEILFKPSGSINGNGFMLDTLHDCEVYLLDHTSQVQIDDCINCKIFIGPTDGSVFLRDCRDCILCVAARQLRTRDCKELDISLYCATQPSIETSTGIVFSCWRGAYPGLTEHFHKARLDPTKNTWRQVYDFNRTEDLGAPHFRLDESVRPWWTAPTTGNGGGGQDLSDDAAAPDCPVPAADGSLFGGGSLPVEHSPPKPESGSLKLPDSLPPSPGRAAPYDEEVELDDDDEEQVTILPLDVEDGGQSLVAPAQPSLPSALSLLPQPSTSLAQLPNPAVLEKSSTAFTFDSPRNSLKTISSSCDIDGISTGLPLWGSGEPRLGMPPQVALDVGNTAEMQQQLPLEGTNDPALGAFTITAPATATAQPPNADARVAWRVSNAKKLAQLAGQENQARAVLREEAHRKLEAMEQTRVARLKQRFASNRAHTSPAGDSGGSSSTAAGFSASTSSGWARVAELVDLTGGASSGSGKSGKAVPVAEPSRDITRLRQLMIALKTQRK
ncbi:hypothetical protein VaNZ11_003463 [Volvox africanus]|uniref:C-CAP/cofactor C-like domain-containing protein n=1 Tax=Volvox africanus TaxID=51714 RepID=A0ABQ5RVC7_9CHLO|nr:hypothetical protein VaNZ11_003463 [Volvox africanus]